MKSYLLKRVFKILRFCFYLHYIRAFFVIFCLNSCSKVICVLRGWEKLAFCDLFVWEFPKGFSCVLGSELMAFCEFVVWKFSKGFSWLFGIVVVETDPLFFFCCLIAICRIRSSEETICLVFCDCVDVGGGSGGGAPPACVCGGVCVDGVCAGGGGGGGGTSLCGFGSGGAGGGVTGNDIFSSVSGKDDTIASEGGDIGFACGFAFGTERTTLFVKTQIWSNMSVYKSHFIDSTHETICNDFDKSGDDKWRIEFYLTQALQHLFQTFWLIDVLMWRWLRFLNYHWKKLQNSLHNKRRDHDISWKNHLHSGRKHVTSHSHGLEHKDPQSRVLNYWFH